MKRKISLTLAVILLLAATSCGNEGNSSNTPSKTEKVPAVETTVVTTKATPTIDSKAQEFAEKLFTKCSHSFVNPLSIKLTNAWYYKFEYTGVDRVDHYFTFEFTVENSAGVEQHVYYGNSRSFNDLSDKEISDAGQGLAFGYSHYFGENEIEAMQKGEKLDAAAIQEYFLKNY